MNNYQLQQVEKIFHEVLSLNTSERRDYLETACGQDEALRQEVEALVSAYENSGSLLEESAITLAFKVMGTDTSEPKVETQIGQYEILRHLGHGGMGDVYLAEDHRLNRKVALKFLSAESITNEWARQQLIKEAQAVAMLDHPNICAVHGFEEIGEHQFIVMQYVEGETLAALLRSKPLNVELAIDLAEQIARALAAAHERGIVHRDIKPQNIIVSRQGQAKILDFGLARLAPRPEVGQSISAWDATKPDGAIIGTVAYMSPEQARGLKLDCRTDLFSFGVVLHEMLGGKNPFLRETQKDTVEAIQTVPPPRLPSSLPPELRRIGEKCLEKAPERRYETGTDLLQAIRRLRSERERAALMGWRRYLQYYAAAACLLIVVGVAWGVYRYRQSTKVHTLAIVPIQNLSGDPDKDYLSAGLTRSLSDRFSFLPRMSVKLPSVVPSRQDEQLVQLARTLSAEAYLSGAIVKKADSFSLQLVLVNTATGAAVWQQDFQLDSAKMVALQDTVTENVSAALRLRFSGDEQKFLIKRLTNNQQALDAYWYGRYYWSKRGRDNLEKAIGYFDEAINLDPAFAKAYAGRADCYVLKSNVLYGPIATREAMEKAGFDARRAVEIDPSLADAHSAVGIVRFIYDWDWPEAEKEFRLAIALNPEYGTAHFQYSNLLAVLGRFDDSIREAAVGKSLDPYSNASALNYGRALYYARRFDEAAACFRQILAADPNYKQGLHMMGLVELARGNYGNAIEHLEALHAQDSLHAAAALGLAYGKAGKRDEALKMMNELDHSKDPIPPFEKVLIYTGLGQRDAAFRELDDSYRDRFANLVYLGVDPIFDDLRGDSRFAELATRIGLAR